MKWIGFFTIFMGFFSISNQTYADESILINETKYSKKENQNISNDRITLDFQDIETKDLLKIFSDFTGLNIIVSDKVIGTVSIHLHDIPWQEALDIILQMKGLSQRQVDKIVMIGLANEILDQEKMMMQMEQQSQEFAPLVTSRIQIHYAKASDVASLLKSEKNSLLSKRAMVSVDDRTNTLLVQDTEVILRSVQELIHQLDVPVKQVLIESRIVFASDDFERELGINLHAVGRNNSENQFKMQLLPKELSNDVAKMAQLGMAITKLPSGILLDLELLALEHEGLGKIIASPRLITSNQQQAYIESGEEIPYQETTSGGGSAIAFKKAVLRLEVIPQITPDNHIILDLKVNQDSRGQVTSGVPAIHTRELHTKALVANGETVVLGGIYQENKLKSKTQVPFLSQIPLIGWFFSSKTQSIQTNELLIFVTPNIIECPDPV